MNDGKNFEALKLALSVLKMGTAEMDGLFKLVSAILHLGNVTFAKNGEGSSVASESAESVKIAASLLECN